MKSLDEIKKTLLRFEETFGIPALTATQGSEEWRQLKLGVPSASNADKIVAKTTSQTRATYMSELVAQVCTGVMEEINSKYLDWGKQNEDAARSYYEFQTGHSIIELPFVYKDASFREGCSPDGFITDNKGFEIKCPYNSVHYIKFLVDDKIKSEYELQAQFTLRVMEADAWDFVQYDPRMRTNPMKILPIERNLETQKTLDDAVPQFICDMDKMLAKIGIKFGSQWGTPKTEAP